MTEIVSGYVGKIEPDQKVFLNFPYNRSFENAYLGIVTALVVLGRTPVATFDLPDHGQGRLERIWTLLEGCGASIHDLSAVGTPVRFNMPFELGLACGLQRAAPKLGHHFYLFEREENRLNRTLTDVKGIDPRIHNGTATGAIRAVLDVLVNPRERITVEEVLWVYRRVKLIVPKIKRQHRVTTLYRGAILKDLVDATLLVRAKQLSRGSAEVA